MLLQLGTAWGTVWLLSSLIPEKKKALSVKVSEQPKHQFDKAENHDSSSKDSQRKSIDSSGSKIQLQEIDVSPKKLTIASILEGVTSIANSANAAAAGAEKSVDELNNYIDRQLAKMDANKDFGVEIFKLQCSVEHAVQIAEKKCAIQQKLAADPTLALQYAKAHTVLSKHIESSQKSRFKLYAFDLQPLDLREMPSLAVDERVIEIKKCLEILRKVKTRIDHDHSLFLEINKLTNEDFRNFLFTQEAVLLRYLQALAPAEKFLDNEDKISVLSSIEVNKNPSSVIRKNTVSPTSGANLSALLDAVRHVDSKSHSDIASVFDGDREGIKSFAQKINIPHLVHFTRSENLAGILKHGLASVATCESTGLSVIRNDADRYDGKPDGISLSIAFPNYLMFYKYRQIFKEADWAVLLFSPRVIWEKDCAFYRHNAADARVSREPRDKMKSLDAFRDMFAEYTGPREPFLRQFDPSDPQAEILVFETIPRFYIEAVAFETKEVALKYKSVIGEIESFYAGPGRGLFGSRLRSRAN